MISKMKSTCVFLLLPLLAAFSAFAETKKQPIDSGYLANTLPPALAFGSDPLPADRLMLVTKAPTIMAPPVIVTTTETNATVSALPIPLDPPVKMIIDPPPATVPTLSVNPADPNTAISTAQRGLTVVTTDDVLDLLELENNNPFTHQPRVVVPFEMPFSQTPATPVLNSKARYIKRWK